VTGWLDGWQVALTGLLLPPLLLVLAIVPTAFAARRWRGAAWLAAGLALGVLALATPLASDRLFASLEPTAAPSGPDKPRAIIILGGDVSHGGAIYEPGPLTLERLRAGAALHRATGLPILVTGGVLGPGEPSLAMLMARSLREDFGIPVRWIEDRARDTRENAIFATAALSAEGIGEALLVTHGWHMGRALQAFSRQCFAVDPRPLRPAPGHRWGVWSLAPRPDHLADSWFALREWAGRLVYAWRDGAPPASCRGI
jgi:uncharacterized SAM-binding protein YcdF (DUF218 family)